MHRGPVQYRESHGYMVTLCPYGHLIASKKLDKWWGGSALEAEIGAAQNGRRREVECDGALGEPVYMVREVESGKYLANDYGPQGEQVVGAFHDRKTARWAVEAEAREIARSHEAPAEVVVMFGA